MKYNCNRFVLNDITIYDYFKNDNNPKIFVNDKNNLFFINWNQERNIIFKTNHGNTNILAFYNTEVCSGIKEKYLITFGHEKLYHRDLLQFIYNGKQIIYEANTTIGQCFQNELNPTIFVNDIYNLLLIDWNQTKNFTFIINNCYKKEFTIGNKSSLNLVLLNFLEKINHYELENINEIKYLYNSQQIPFLFLIGGITVGEFFLFDYNPVIFVIDINNLIKPIDITFKTCQGSIFTLTSNCKRTVGYLLMQYLDEISHSELIDRYDKIKFLYKTQQIKFGDKTNIGDLFLNCKNPIILVLDSNNILSNNQIQKMRFLFKNTYGTSTFITVNYGTTIQQLIKKYLYKVYSQDLIDNYNSNKVHLKFLYNGKTITGEQSYVEDFFGFNNCGLFNILADFSFY